MKNYTLLFWKDPAHQADPSVMQKVGMDWMEWMGSLKTGGNLADEGTPFGPAKQVTSDKVSDGAISSPDGKVIICYCIIKADDLGEATELAKNCPSIEPLALTVTVHEAMQMQPS